MVLGHAYCKRTHYITLHYTSFSKALFLHYCNHYLCVNGCSKKTELVYYNGIEYKRKLWKFPFNPLNKVNSFPSALISWVTWRWWLLVALPMNVESHVMGWFLCQRLLAEKEMWCLLGITILSKLQVIMDYTCNSDFISSKEALWYFLNTFLSLFVL